MSSSETQEQIVVVPPKTDAMQQQMELLVRRAEKIVVECQDDQETAASLITSLAAARKAVVGLFAQPKTLAHQTHKSITAAEKSLLDPIKKAREVVDGKVTEYVRLEQKRAEDEARQKAAELAAQEQEEADRAAAEAEAEGHTEMAQEIREEAAVAPPPVVKAQPRVAKVAGQHQTTRWSAEVIDKVKVLQAIIARPEHLAGVEISMKYFNKLAQAQHEDFSFPGMKAVSNTTTTTKV